MPKYIPSLIALTYIGSKSLSLGDNSIPSDANYAFISVSVQYSTELPNYGDIVLCREGKTGATFGGILHQAASPYRTYGYVSFSWSGNIITVTRYSSSINFSAYANFYK
jgi:hypothetical protein